MRPVVLLVGILASAVAPLSVSADSPVLTVENALIASPAAPGARSPALATTDSGVLLTWTDPAAPGRTPRTATFDTTSRTWRTLADTQALSPPRPPADAPFAEPSGFASFRDGSALAAYFDDQSATARGLFAIRYVRDKWQPPCLLEAAPATPPDCPLPHERPVVLANGHRAAVVWFSTVGKTPRLLAAFSSSAGNQFFQPIQIDDGHPRGTASAAMLGDGSLYVAWIETHADLHQSVLWLRRISATNELSVPVLLATGPSLNALREPQLALANDYTTSSPARLLVAYTLETENIPQLVTRLITLPPADTFTRGRPCSHCPPSDDTLPGHPIRGRILKIEPATQMVVARHEEIPGVMPAMKMPFHIDAETLAQLQPDTEFIARTERREDGWWLLHLQPLGKPPHR